MDNYKNLTELGVEAYVKALEEIDWFDLPQNDQKKIEQKLLKEKDPICYALVLDHLHLDTEGFEFVKDYEELFEKIVKLSGLKITSKNFKEDKKNGDLKITIKTKNRTYEYSIDMENFGDWIDGNFIEKFINEEIFKGEKIESRLMALPPLDQTLEFVFIPKEVHKSAVKKGIIPSDMEYFM